MPSQEKRPTNMPDPSESRERAVPEKEAGLGQMSETRNTPVARPEKHDQARDQNERHRELTAGETMDHSDGVSPTDAKAPGDRAGAGEAEATGKVRRSDSERQAERGVQRGGQGGR